MLGEWKWGGGARIGQGHQFSKHEESQKAGSLKCNEIECKVNSRAFLPSLKIIKKYLVIINLQQKGTQLLISNSTVAHEPDTTKCHSIASR